MAEFILVLKPPDKLIFTAWALRSYQRNDLSVDDLLKTKILHLRLCQYLVVREESQVSRPVV
jgi:hypothetical protein